MGDDEPRRGEVWLVSFGPAVGGEIQKTRPAVVVSNDVANARLNRLQVVPLSSRLDRLYPAETVIDVAGTSRKAMADQVTTISKQRLLRRIGTLGLDDFQSVMRVIRIQLSI